MITFQSSIVRIQLHADSRGNVLFSLWRLTDSSMDNWVPLLPEQPLACEYLPDLHAASEVAMLWIHNNCDEIVEDGTHLYYRFRKAEQK